ncbi:MAG: energy transducer TonB [Telluria sp.]|jgi:protein TonB
MKKLSLIAALAIVSATAFAGEVPASLDTKSCKAEYPKAALVNEEEGTVTASFLVTAEGTVTDSKLEKSSGSKTLDKATLKALASCKFKPGSKDGAPAQTWAKVDYVWKL